MVAYWIQGLRNDRDSSDGSWIPLVCGRMLNHPDREPSGAKTSTSERILGIGHNSYYYLGFSHPDFGMVLFAFEPCVSSGGKKTFSVSPFDTGALATGKLDAPSLSSQEQKRAFINQYSYGRNYQSKFSDWTKQAYSPNYVQDYVEGKPPSSHFCAKIMIPQAGSSSDARCWVWEARVPKQDMSDGLSNAGNTIDLSLDRIWIGAQHLKELRASVYDNPRLGETDGERIIDFLNDDTKIIRVDGDDASEEARKWLEVNQKW